MTAWHFYSLETGLLLPVVFYGPEDGAQLNAPPGHGAIAGVADAASQRVDLATGLLTDWQPPRPIDDDERTWSWDATAKRWVSQPTMDARRAAVWAAVKAERAARLNGTFTCNGLVFQIDQLNVPGAALDAMRAQQSAQFWSQDWVLADNSVVTLSAADMIAVGVAMRAAISALWATSQALRAQIDAAATADDLSKIEWP